MKDNYYFKYNLEVHQNQFKNLFSLIFEKISTPSIISNVCIYISHINLCLLPVGRGRSGQLVIIRRLQYAYKFQYQPKVALIWSQLQANGPDQSMENLFSTLKNANHVIRASQRYISHGHRI